MHLEAEDVAQIVQEVWSSMLGLDCEMVEVEVPADGPSVAASVGVSGAADVLISLETPFEGARTYAAGMFGLGEDECSDNDISDAVGELANMVGGNIKSLLPEPSTLSLPVVAQGRPPTLRVPGGHLLLDSTFMSADHPIFVRVWNRPNGN